MNAIPMIAVGLLHQVAWDGLEREAWLQQNGVKLRYVDSDEIAAHVAVREYIGLDPWDRPPAGAFDTSWS